MDRLTTMSSFVQVVNKTSFTCAARQLKLSQGAVTGHAQSLEQQLGFRLLNRTMRKVSLTEEGIQLYRRCIRILADVAEIENLATSLRQTPRGRLRLNTDVTLARVVGPLALRYLFRGIGRTDHDGPDQRSRRGNVRFGNSCRLGVGFQPDPTAARQGAAGRLCVADLSGAPRHAADPGRSQWVQLPQCQRCKLHASLAIHHRGGRARDRGHGKSVRQQHRGRPSGGAQRARRLPAAATRVRTFLDFVARRLREIDIDRPDHLEAVPRRPDACASVDRELDIGEAAKRTTFRPS
jgi:DNA-binding transcriptional LysR family regulator